MSKDLYRVRNWDGSVVIAVKTIDKYGFVTWSVPRGDGSSCQHNEKSFYENHELV